MTEVALPGGVPSSARDFYDVLDKQKPPSPSRLSTDGYPPRRGATGPLSPLDNVGRRPGSPVFAMQTMDDIRRRAKGNTLDNTQTMAGMQGLGMTGDTLPGAFDDPSASRGVGRGGGRGLDEDTPVPVVLTDSPTWMLVQKSPSEMMEELKEEWDLVDSNGWTCLHWAALQGLEEHAALLLDCGSDCYLETKRAIQHVSGDRRSGTTAEDLARFPGGAIKGHSKIIAILKAAERGGWQQRKLCKQNGDAATLAQDWVLAVHWYEKALGAVLQIEDTEVHKIKEPLRIARMHAEREEAERIRLEEQRREEERLREEERRRREEEERLRQQRRFRALQEGKERLKVGDGQGAIRCAVAAMEGMDDLQELVLAASQRVISDEVKSLEAILNEKLRMEQEKMRLKIEEAQEAAREAHRLRVLEAAEYASKLAQETAELKAAKERAERELAAEKKRLNDEMEKLKQKLQEEMERYKKEKDRQVELARQAQERAEAERDRAQKENDRLNEQYRQWQIERTEMMAELDRLRKELADLKRLLEEYERRLLDLARLQLMEREFDKLKAERDALLLKVAELEGALQGALDELARLQEEYRNAMAAMKELLEKEQSEHAATRAERDALQAKCNALEARIKEMEEEARRAREEYERELAAKLAELERRLTEEMAATMRALEAAKRAAENRQMELQGELAMLRANTARTIREQQTEIINLKEALTDEQLRNERLRADAKVHELEKQEWQLERERMLSEHRKKIEQLQIKHAAEMQELTEAKNLVEARLASTEQELRDARDALAAAELLNAKLRQEMQEQLAQCAAQINELMKQMEELQLELEATNRKLTEANKAIIENIAAAERAKAEARRLRTLLEERDETIRQLTETIRLAEEKMQRMREEHAEAMRLAEAERQRLLGVMAEMQAEMDRLNAELAQTQKWLREEKEAHEAERQLRMERERELAGARRTIAQQMETIRLKDEALRLLTEEAKQAVIDATNFLAGAVRQQQQDLQTALHLKMGATLDGAPATHPTPPHPCEISHGPCSTAAVADDPVHMIFRHLCGGRVPLAAWDLTVPVRIPGRRRPEQRRPRARWARPAGLGRGIRARCRHSERLERQIQSPGHVGGPPRRPPMLLLPDVRQVWEASQLLLSVRSLLFLRSLRSGRGQRRAARSGSRTSRTCSRRRSRRQIRRRRTPPSSTSKAGSRRRRRRSQRRPMGTKPAAGRRL